MQMSCSSFDERELKILVTLSALGARSVCPRLPRLGEVILTRCMEDAYEDVPREESTWLEEQIIVEEHWNGGTPVSCLVSSGRPIVRGTYRGNWIYPAKHLYGNRKDD